MPQMALSLFSPIRPGLGRKHLAVGQPLPGGCQDSGLSISSCGVANQGRGLNSSAVRKEEPMTPPAVFALPVGLGPGRGGRSEGTEF